MMPNSVQFVGLLSTLCEVSDINYRQYNLQHNAIALRCHNRLHNNVTIYRISCVLTQSTLSLSSTRLCWLFMVGLCPFGLRRLAHGIGRWRTSL